MNSNESRKSLNPTAIYDPRETQHLRAGFYPPPGPSTWVGDLLPYHQLGGPGLERLCYLLLLAQGKVPRYFGKPGQKQYGIDLLVTHGDETTVYQCKNEQSLPLHKMKAVLRLFEAEWLGRPELPRPTEFVLCCPVPLQELKQNEAWTTLEREFQARTGVSVAFWDHHYLDERLRRLPDVVADLFSDRAAERFCNLPDWNSDLFRPLVAGSGERNIDRYLALKEASRLYLAPKLEESFTQKLEQSSSLLIWGLPGTGKTMTGLALAESLRHRHGLYRIFYINLRHDIDEDTLVQGVRRRLTQPTIFFFDDCHAKYDLLDRVQNRLRPILAERPGRGLLVFTARTAPTPQGMPRGVHSDFEESLAENESVLGFQPTPRLFRQIITLAKPHFAGLSKERLQKIFEFTGHDLFLLDQLLEMLDSPDEIDRLVPERLFEETLVRYFGAPTVYRPGFMKLAALAQFDLAPPIASFDFKLDQEDEKAASQLLVVAGRRPPRYYFLHSSAAELVFRALAWNEGRDDHPALAADYLVEFFKSRPVNDKQIVEDLANVIHNRLGLERDQRGTNYLRSRFLADDGIYTLIESVFEQLPLNSLAICLIILKSTDAMAFEHYRDLVQRKVDDGSVLRMTIERPFWDSGLFLYLVKRAYPLLLSGLRSQLVDRGIRSLIKNTDLQNILALLANLSDPGDSWWTTSLDLIPRTEFDEMIQRTVASGRSIGTIHSALRELKKTDKPLLEKLESKIGAERYLHLIGNVGTIFELFRVIQYSSLSMAGELIESLDDETLDDLIAQTIASGRSIGTINLALRELKKTDKPLLEKLESKIGAERYLHLIVRAGTIFELFMVIRDSSPSMAGELIESLDAETLDDLIAKTIASGRSIGTINLALWELKKTDPDLLEKLERVIGAERYLHLIVSAGTILDLFRVIQHSSPSMAGDLIEALNAEALDALIARTIASGRSIGTINLALWELKKTDPDLLEKLERVIGAERYLHLIGNVGTIFELFRVIQYSSLSMAGELIESLDDETLDDLIAQTIASGRSIGTIHLALRELKKTDPDLLERLERKIGAEHYLHLIVSAGTIFELFMVIRDSSPSMAGELIESLDAETLDDLIAKTIASGRSIGTLDWTLRELKNTDPALLEKLERRIGVKRWWQLICANGTMHILTRILQRLDRFFRQELAESSQELSLDEWQELLLRGHFADLCHFIRWKAHLFSAQFTSAFLDSLEPTFETLIRGADWTVLGRGMGFLAAASESPIKQYLLALLHDYIATVKLSSLRFDSFDEATACVSLLWHQLPSQRQELINSLSAILPAEDVWYNGEKFLRSARLLFFILADPQARPDDARRILSIGNSEAVAPLCTEATTLDVFLYLWNLYSLWFQGAKEGEKAFADFLHPEVRNALTNVLVGRFQSKANQAETDNLIALAGFVFFSGVAFNPAEKAAWASTLPSFEELLRRASSKTFIPAVFFLFGLEWIFDRKNDISARTWRRVLPKAEEYAEKSAALEHLCDLVRAHAKMNSSL